MENDGFEKRNFDEVADVYVINTCSVTDNADKECRMLVRRIQRKAPEAMVVVTGCYAQLKPEEIAAIPGVDLVLGAAEKFNITQHLKEITRGDNAKICSCDIADVNVFTASHSINDRTRIFLKVQDGCDYNCSFCTIPLARGKSRSDSINNVLANVKEIAKQGGKEIVLTGINLGDFASPLSARRHSPGLSGGDGGETKTGAMSETKIASSPALLLAEKGDAKIGADGRYSKGNFFSLIKALDEVDGIERFRISSIEPNLLTNDIIEFVSNSKRFMPHFHIPLQSGSNKILGLMRRRYKKEFYAERVGLIKTLMPHCCIGVDVIVGFPGETEEDFKETVNFLSGLDISYLHVFTYSERADTFAIGMKPVVPMTVRHERNKILRNLSYQKTQYFTSQNIGETRKVLFEMHNKNNMLEGYTDNYIKITTPYTKEWEKQIVEWKI